MKAGSLVVVKKLNVPADWMQLVKWLPVDDEETVYTVREITEGVVDMGAETNAVLEEGTIGISPYDGREMGIKLPWLKEVQPPMSLDELMEEVNSKELFKV